MKTPIMVVALLLVGLSAVASAEDPDQVTGWPTVTDGDSLRFGEIRVRFHGIDAPETRQKCRDANGAEYHCGIRATDAMVALIHEKEVVCLRTDTDRYGRMVARCFIVDDDVDLGSMMVSMGWAVAYRKYSKDHVAAEDAAREAGVGMWAGTFDMPWDWRRAN